MKLLVLSDTHLTLPFEEKKYQLLKRIIFDADQVVINGDFWEGYLHSFDDFIRSDWKKLFPLLKKKQTIYILGNHDRLIFADKKKFSLFSDKQLTKYVWTSRDKTFVFEHGNRHLPLEESLPDVTVPLFRLTVAFWNMIEHLCIIGTGNRYQRMLQKYNDKIKKKIRKEYTLGEYFVCGHTHCQEVDLENRFINTGIIKYGLAQFMYIEDGIINTVEERY